MEPLPTGSQIDARRGTLALIAAGLRRGNTHRGVFSGAVFSVSQDRSGPAKTLTTVSLLEGDFPGAPSYARCRSHHDSDGLAAHAARSSRVLQTLHASVQGHYQTRGRYSLATVRGAVWDVSDRCDGTRTVVHRGKVLVTDSGRRVTSGSWPATAISPRRSCGAAAEPQGSHATVANARGRR